jgi:uncharacterized protein
VTRAEGFRGPAAHETGQRCRDCGAFHYPPRTLCRICRGRHLSAERLSGRGVVHAFRRLPPGSCPPTTAWVAAWVELEEGAVIGAQVLAQDAVIGLPVKLVARDERRRLLRPPLGFAFRAVHSLLEAEAEAPRHLARATTQPA